MVRREAGKKRGLIRGWGDFKINYVVNKAMEVKRD
jgi:hypothetical protein